MEAKTEINSKRDLNLLLTPSWLSGLIVVAAGLVLTVGVVLAFSFNNSQIQQQLVGLQNTVSPSLTLPGQTPPGGGNNSLQNTWPLLGFWAVVGLVVYLVVETVAKSVRQAMELRHEMDYVHARRDLIAKTAAEFVLIRAVAAVILLVLVQLFFKKALPYSITAAHAAASDLRSPGALLDALLAFSLVAVSLHVMVIFLRLSLRRARIFSNNS